MAERSTPSRRGVAVAQYEQDLASNKHKVSSSSSPSRRLRAQLAVPGFGASAARGAVGGAH